MDVRRGGIFPLGDRGRMVGRIPVIDGPSNEVPPRAEWPTMAPCSACGAGDRNGVVRHRVIVDLVWLVLCVDWRACVDRFRRAGR